MGVGCASHGDKSTPKDADADTSGAQVSESKSFGAASQLPGTPPAAPRA